MNYISDLNQPQLMEAATALLQKYWGYTSFRPLQKDIIQAVLEKKNVLALMPTGGGKSLCFQVPALLQEGTCVVISPLIALMQDQVSQLRQQGIPSAAIYAGMRPREVDTILDNCIYGTTKLLYVSPERLETDLFRARVAKMRVSLLAVDEAHCISQWGYDFRPAYQKIASIKPLMPEASILALTATATPEVKKDIVTQLALKQPHTFQRSFTRENLSLYVRTVQDSSQAVVEALHKVAGCAIVYAPTRKQTQWLAQYLQQKGISATYYHAGLPADQRQQRQQAWLKEAVRVMVATNAFGMGINKPNVRLVIHTAFPDTLEAYYQEAGRAGRDGEKAFALVLHEPSAAENLEKRMAQAYPTKKTLQAVYQRLTNYYQIAVGSHADTIYPFDIEDFAHTYAMKAALVYTALQRLQEADLLQYNDRFCQPASVHITTSPQQLYAFQVANPSLDLLIKRMHHIYNTSIFAELTPISLKRLARQLETTPKRIHQQLEEMQKLGILTYMPAQHQPTLTFLTPRYAVDHLPIAAKELQTRQKVMQRKAEAVLYYMSHTQRCRMQLLLEYLGEISYDKCMRCDICLSPQPQPELTPKAQAACEKEIITLLQQKPHSTRTLIESLRATYPQAHILTTLDQMLAHHQIGYNDSLQLTLD